LIHFPALFAFALEVLGKMGYMADWERAGEALHKRPDKVQMHFKFWFFRAPGSLDADLLPHNWFCWWFCWAVTACGAIRGLPPAAVLFALQLMAEALLSGRMAMIPCRRSAHAGRSGGHRWPAGGGGGGAPGLCRSVSAPCGW
jgi:hypothetical protein